MTSSKPDTKATREKLATLATSARFHSFTSALLHALAGDEASARQCATLLDGFLGSLSTRNITLNKALPRAIRSAVKSAQLRVEGADVEEAQIVLARAGMRLFAETLATDVDSDRRRVHRSEVMHAASVAHMLECELRSQTEGWSYLGCTSAEAPENGS